MIKNLYLYPIYFLAFIINDYTIIRLSKSSTKREFIIFIISITRMLISSLLAVKYNLINIKIMIIAVGYFINENLYLMVLKKRNSVFMDLCYHSRLILVTIVNTFVLKQRYTILQYLGISFVFVGLILPNMAKNKFNDKFFYIFIAMVCVVISTTCLHVYDMIMRKNDFDMWIYKFTYDFYLFLFSLFTYICFFVRNFNQDLEFLDEKNENKKILRFTRSIVDKIGVSDVKDILRCIYLSLFSIFKFYLFAKMEKINRLILPLIISFITRIVNSFFIYQNINRYEWVGLCITTVGVVMFNIKEFINIVENDKYCRK
ncbi:hypothetical protein DMUE_3081 [Dictyocoela muelleri]|nr:hypothetical protein DMUE_3081 [Dictyocoela muelleri]